MDENKMHLVNKIFNNETIRTIWDKEQEKYFIRIDSIIRNIPSISVTSVSRYLPSCAFNFKPLQFVTVSFPSYG